MKYPNQRKSALLTGFLILTLLAGALALPVSASVRAAQHHHGYQALAFDVENGRITDHDGRIGNSLRGADAAHHRRHPHHRGMPALPRAVRDVKEGVRRVADDVTQGARDAAENAGRAVGDLAREAEDQMTRDGTDETTQDTTGDSAVQNGGRGVIGWVIAILVILAIALVVLALLPKKSHERH